jgi:phage gpG-like protein
MAQGINIEVSDAAFQRLLNRYKSKVNQSAALIDRELAATGELMATSAKNLVNVDTGRLRNSISLKKDQFLSYYLIAQTNYAAYVEFGTGNGFIPPENQEWSNIASKFKGRGIKQVNLPARPYMRPSILAYYPIFKENAIKIIRSKNA